MMKITHIKRKRDQRKKRVAAYCRVSTTLESQEESFDAQVRIYTEYIKSNPEWEFAGIYSDEKSAARAKNRRGFQQMIKNAVDGAIDYILVKSISRFSRNIVDCQNYVNYLKGNGVEIYFEKENISTFDPSSSMIFSLMGTIAQNESESISENVCWGYKERYKQGKFNLGNNRMLGYDTVEGKLVPNKDAWIVRLVYKIFCEGKTYREISYAVEQAGGRRLRSRRMMTSSCIRDILRNETYVGDKCLQKRPHTSFFTKKPDKSRRYESHYLKNDHEAIIDRNTWEKVQSVLDQREQEKNQGIIRNGKESFLYGKIFCGVCGSVYTRRTLKRYAKNKEEQTTYKAWSCRERVKGKKGSGCKNETIREDQLLEKLCDICGWEQFDPERFLAEVDRVIITGDTIEVKRVDENVVA